MDDDPDLREIWAEALNLAGHKAHAAPNAVEGMKLIGLHTFDIILLDINMPRLSGVEMFKRLHSVEADLPIVVISGSIDPKLNQALKEAGAAQVYKKPFALDDLLDAVARFARQPEE